MASRRARGASAAGSRGRGAGAKKRIYPYTIEEAAHEENDGALRAPHKFGRKKRSTDNNSVLLLASECGMRDAKPSAHTYVLSHVVDRNPKMVMHSICVLLVHEFFSAVGLVLSGWCGNGAWCRWCVRFCAANHKRITWRFPASRTHRTGGCTCASHGGSSVGCYGWHCIDGSVGPGELFGVGFGGDVLEVWCRHVCWIVSSRCRRGLA